MGEPRVVKRTRVMVVDDDPIVLEVTRERLESAGYDVVVHGAGLGTSVAVMRERPDFVLLDVNMPALAGDALARMLSKNGVGATTSVILYSGQEAGPLSRLADSCGAVGAVTKTHSATVFMDQFERCVATARTRRPS